MASISIDRRFAAFGMGGRLFAVGGYVCGVITRGWSSATVTLRAPTPVDTSLELRVDDEERELALGDDVLASAVPDVPDIPAPEPVDPGAARAAMSLAPGVIHQHPAPRCFVCGPDRVEGDGMRILAGPLGDGRFAAIWPPAKDMVDGDDRVASEFIWAALECPAAASFWVPGTAPLAYRTTAMIERRPQRQDLVVVAEPLGATERGHRTATWILDRDGVEVARAHVEWIVVSG